MDQKLPEAINCGLFEISVSEAKNLFKTKYDETNEYARETGAGYYRKDQLEAKTADLMKSIEKVVIA